MSKTLKEAYPGSKQDETKVLSKKKKLKHSKMEPYNRKKVVV